MAIRELNAVGIDKINNPETIMRWNGMFRNYEKFAHPNLKVELNRLYLPPFLDIYPDAKEDICKWCSKNIESLSSEKLANYIRDELIPKLYQQEVENRDRTLTYLTLDDFKKALKISEFGVSTAFIGEETRKEEF